MELADESYVKYCNFCGRRIKTAVLYKGYVFCSVKCRDSFTSNKETPKAKPKEHSKPIKSNFARLSTHEDRKYLAKR